MGSVVDSNGLGLW